MFLIYHNPLWSKSRESVKILEKHKIEYRIINYIKDGISESKINEISKILDISIIDLIRKKDLNYRNLNLTVEQTKDEKFLTEKISKNPKILQRPIIINDDKGIIGRPPEKILDLIGSWKN